MSRTELSQQWSQVLGILEGQMTQATFDTWVKPTHVLALDGDKLKIGVRNAYAQQWLHTKLRVLVERAAQNVFGRALDVQFVLYAPEPRAPNADGETPRPGDLYVEFIESPLTPYIFVQKYAIWYWQPLLGSLAFSTWLMLRTLDKLNEGRGIKHKLSVEILAATLDCHRQSLTGRNPSGKIEGAFGVLNQFKLSRIEVIGKGHDAIYWARVLNAVPLLTPAQVERLPDLIRERHAIFLRDFSVDVEKWEQLEIPTLIED